MAAIAAARRPVVTIFSRIPGIQALLQKRHPNIPTKVVDAGPMGSGIFLEKKMAPEELKELGEAEIILTDTPIVIDMLYKFPNLKWMQSTWAGVDSVFDNLDKSKPLPSYKLTRFAGMFGIHMREYIIGHIIARERVFDELREDQAKGIWDYSLRANYRLLTSLSIGILGVGDIGKSIAEACKLFGMTVWGLVRQDLPIEERSPHVDHYLKMDALPELLQNCDYVCNVLPSTNQTKGLLNGNILENCKEKKSVFINIGRGDIMSEESLLNALRQKWISSAILDVFPIEPLPAESPLWNMKQVTVSPHIAAISFSEEVVDLFSENYEKYVNGEELNYEVSWERGY
ncbi:glyoxylate/hydroxypyruvate reductase A-like [Glandiceps talaboti]